MWELDCEESWAPKNWCFWTVVLEKTLVGPLDCKEIQPVHPKGDQSWVFIGRTDTEAETPILWPPHAKSWLIGKDSDAGMDWGQEKGTTEDEMAGWHQQLDALSLDELRELVMDREAWCAAIHGVTKSWTWLSDWTEYLGITCSPEMLNPFTLHLLYEGICFSVSLSHSSLCDSKLSCLHSSLGTNDLSYKNSSLVWSLTGFLLSPKLVSS